MVKNFISSSSILPCQPSLVWDDIFFSCSINCMWPQWRHWPVSTSKTVILKILFWAVVGYLHNSRLNPGNYQMCKTHQITNYFLSLISHYISLILEQVTCQQFLGKYNVAFKWMTYIHMNLDFGFSLDDI